MTGPQRHPDKFRLRDFHEGTPLPDGLAEEIANHVGGCADCQAFTRDLTEPHQLAQLRSQSPPVSATPPDRSIDPPELLRRISQDGNYDIVRNLGAGGMGSVYLATDCKNKRRVAIKLLCAYQATQPVYRQRLQREIHALKSMRHRNIVGYIDDVSVGDGIAVLVMEYVEGEDVAAMLTRVGKLSYWQACRFGVQALSALDYLDTLKVVHRDLKPANLVVTPSGHLKLVDFGLAKDFLSPQATGHPTPDGTVLGTPAYMAPEQASRPGSVDVRTDMYSLGCVLYELMTGRPPFIREDARGYLLAHELEKPLSLRRLVRTIPREIDGAILKMLQKKPDDRFQTPRAAILALSPFREPAPNDSRIKTAAKLASLFLIASGIGALLYFLAHWFDVC